MVSTHPVVRLITLETGRINKFDSTGFRKPENVVRTLELELWFYGQIFGFPVEGVEGVEISNWP